MTDAEERLVEQYVRVLDFMSRCARAIDRGDWHYLRGKTLQLEDAAVRLAKVTEEAYAAWNADRHALRGPVVRAAVVHNGRHYRAGRLLHPEDEGGADA